MLNLGLLAMALLPFAFADPYPGCPTQPSGCVFLLDSSEGTLADVNFACAAYDKDCNPLHGHDGPCDPGSKVTTVGDQYLTVERRGGGGSSLYATFEYQGHEYSQGTHQDCSQGLTGCTNLWIPFPC